MLHRRKVLVNRLNQISQEYYYYYLRNHCQSLDHCFRFSVPVLRLFFAFVGLMNLSNHWMNWKISNLDFALATAFDNVPDLLFFFISFFARVYLSRNRLKSFSASAT